MNEDGGFQPRSFAPVKVGEEIDVTVEAVGAKGDGIAKKEGFVLFIPGVQKGDNVRVKITRVLRNVGFAEVVGQGGSDAAEGATDEAPADDSAEQAASDEAPADEGQEVAEEPAQDSEDFGEEKKE